MYQKEFKHNIHFPVHWFSFAFLRVPGSGHDQKVHFWQAAVTNGLFANHKEYLRTGCDMMHLFCMFDEHPGRASPAEVWEQAAIQVDAIYNPETPRPRGEWVGGEFARQFFLRIPETATETFRERFRASGTLAPGVWTPEDKTAPITSAEEL
ncbi:hypothetical protein QBC43DRAFT_339324 [Cladorrhinum sp. PSN259]|nr:hypothetical protein QBC43DRAFT_339324 [Cladorrhinum sp. PSN259]